ncbi:hypothetical protein [Nostoc sp. TCL26-01]|nr:hypothetical protein [Nostoc sp. TCL26-01]
MNDCQYLLLGFYLAPKTKSRIITTIPLMEAIAYKYLVSTLVIVQHSFPR